MPFLSRLHLAAARRAPVFVVVTTLLCALTLAIGYANKARCIGPEYDSEGRSTPNYGIRITRDVCYTDIQFLWLGRDINQHVFPYVHGGYDAARGELYGGAVEYPVLTGLAIWLAALPSDTDGEFLTISALLLSIAGLLSAAMLAWLAGLRAWWFALAPPLVLYAFHNWDLFAVCATVVACWVLLRATGNGRSAVDVGAGDAPGRMNRGDATDPALRNHGSFDGDPMGTGVRSARPLIAAAVALGVGAGFKLYPAMFALPVACWLGAGGWRPGPGTSRGRRWAVGAGFLVGTGAVFAMLNLPFMIAGWRGWWASFQFQWSRPIDMTTNTIWFWLFRPYSNSANDVVQERLATAATIATLLGLLLAVGVGWLRFRKDRVYPWLPVCAAMLAAYLLFNKVHSPQFVLWLLPFFVLLRVRAGWILAYFVADAAIGIGFFRWQYLINSRLPDTTWDAFSPQAVLIGVWGRVALLIALFVVFSRAPVVELPESPVPVGPKPQAPAVA